MKSNVSMALWNKVKRFSCVSLWRRCDAYPSKIPNSYPEIFLNSVLNSQKYLYLKVVPWGLIHRRSLFRWVWYPTGLCQVGYQAPQDIVLWGIRPRRTSVGYKCTQLCHCSAASETPQDLVLWVLIPCRILFCGVWYPAGFCSAGYQTPLAS
jgi:hypothetical protein